MKRSILAIVVLVGSAQTDPNPPRMPKAEIQTLQSFADTHKDCRAWTDACMTCLRKDDGTFGCSVPGIACEPKTFACREAKP